MAENGTGTTGFNLQYETAKKNEVIKEIQQTMSELETAYKSILGNWETIKAKMTLEPKIMNELNAIASNNGDDNLTEMRFNTITKNMNNIIESLGKIDQSWTSVSDKIGDAVHNFGQQKNQGGHITD